MAITIKDVAERAGVSVATASRVLSGGRKVSAELADRVRESARELGYRHNAVARALRHGRTSSVGMIVPEIGNPFFPSLVEAVERTLSDSGRDLLLCDAQQDPAMELRRARTLMARQVDGLILIPVSASASRAALDEVASQLPVIQLDRFVQDYLVDWVGVDDALGITLAVEHVTGLGAKRIAFVSAAPECSSAQQRLRGFTDATRRLGLLGSGSRLLGEFSAGWGRAAAQKLLAESSLPDAVVCGNDEIAVGLLGEFRRARVRVPDDVLVTGFDDIRFAALADPPLTTVRQPHEVIASECIRLLDARMNDTDLPVQRIAIAPSLITRESTGIAS
ncbi:MAG: LacI family DNA-binding transcriptional regulator [Coriobacteriia bacterium]|nr:LacI family DNA-binding transcriptional regulator [Coriobacteriia bacterium]MBN2840264.1 LacI family DNA-binding transcriptional regulator [Coriobacteriia bacterium]